MSAQKTKPMVPWDNISVVSVDVDGTLYWVFPVIARLFLKALLGIFALRFRMVFVELRSILYFYRKRREIHEAQGEFRYEEDPHERNLILERTSRYMAPQVRRVGLRPGVRKTLEALRAKGLKVVALSDHYSDAKLHALGVHHLFDAVYAAEETGHLKPHPKGFMAVCDAEGIQPEQLVHIGDRDETDGIGARSIGAHALILEQDFPSFRKFPLP